MNEFNSVIGITGKARHGKDTVGRMLGELLPHYKHYAFAEPIKTFVHQAMVAPKDPQEAKEELQEFKTKIPYLQTAFDAFRPAMNMYGGEPMMWLQSLIDTLQETHEDSFRIKGRMVYFTSSWRKLYQVIGTEWGRQKINNRIWVDPYIPKYPAIITDVRAYGDSQDRDVEAQAILDAGGMVIEVVDPRKGDEVRFHSSEAGVSRGHITTSIYNNGTLDDLRTKVKHLVEGRILC